MRVKQHNVCQTCRSKKLGCDGIQPKCGQCNVRGLVCDWRSTLWTFMPQRTHASGSRRKNDGRGDRRKQQLGQHMSGTHLQGDALILANTIAGPCTLVTRPLYEDVIESILDAFVPRQRLPFVIQEPKEVPRICGAWVGVLDKLVQNRQPRYNRVLSLGMAALSSTVRLEPHTASIGTYSAAINALRTDIFVPENLSDPEVVATIMCLTLAELFLPDSRFGLAMHVNGVAQFFQQNGPERFKSGVLHELFAGFRPLFILQAFQSRTATFIALDEWIRIPFSSRHPSLMQTLLSHTACIPSLLQQTDMVLASSRNASLDQATALCTKYLELSSAMRKWEQLLQFHYPGSLWHLPSSSKLGPSLPPGRSIWFSDITMANVYTHLWTFRIICAIEFDRLLSLYPSADLHCSVAHNIFSSQDIQGHNETLAGIICCCMEYLIQGDLKLFGPLSAMLPLQTAYRVYVMDRQRNSLHIAYIESVVERLVKKGIISAPYVIYG